MEIKFQADYSWSHYNQSFACCAKTILPADAEGFLHPDFINRDIEILSEVLCKEWGHRENGCRESRKWLYAPTIDQLTSDFVVLSESIRDRLTDVALFNRAKAHQCPSPTLLSYDI